MDTHKALCHDPDHTPRWGMTIDVNRCVGCQTCTIACKDWNSTMPDVQWRRVIDVENGTFPDVERLFLVTGCQHCEEPPCVPVCPTGATRQREDGLVTMDYNQCIGCGYCAVACPYQARTIAHEQEYYYGDDLPTIQEKRAYDQDRVGVAQKCTFCIDKVDSGLAMGLTPGVDPDATPACAASCITQAIRFGDFNDPSSVVSELTAAQPHFQMHEDLGTNPQIKYLYAPPPALPVTLPNAERTDALQRDLTNSLVGQQQKFWDWRAAMNWCFGGLASGTVVMSWLWSLIIEISHWTLAWFHLFAGVLMAIGLFFVFLKIGHKARFYKAIMRPTTSWMTRELYAVPVFGMAVLASLARPSSSLLAITAFAALVFLICQAKILHMGRGIAAWRGPLIPWLIVATGLLEGAGLLSIAMLLPWLNVAGGAELISGMGLILSATAMGLWGVYVATARAAGLPILSRDVIVGITPVLVLGYSISAIAWGLLLTGAWASSIALLVAGSFAIAGGFLCKFTIIVKASYQQGFSLGMVKPRTTGDRVVG
jgi:phenylacetyl-CoA:acceptor oxidoreductase subunit 1